MLLSLSVAKLDAAWYYNRIPPGGDPGDERTYERAKDWIEQHGHSGFIAPVIAIDEGEDHIYFLDGNNRFAALRDLGYRIVTVWADAKACDELRSKYSAGTQRARS